MSNRGLAHTPPPSVVQDPLGYWWPVCRGPELIRAFLATPEADAWRAIERNPMLLMPELVEAAERAHGPERAIVGLREMQHALRGSPAYAPYHRLLARALGSERRGSRRTNLERALAVIQDVRRVEPDQEEDARIEQSLRAALEALTPLPGARPQPTRALFLDASDLDGFQRGAARLDGNPHRADRAYAQHGGLQTGSIEWIGDEAAAIHRLIDARWVFASTRDAKAYIDSPGTQLLARDGLANPAVLQIADGAYAWGGNEPNRARQCLLFRVGRVVAKLDAHEGPRAAHARQSLSRQLLLPYAELVQRRIRWALAPYWLAIGDGALAAQKLLQAPARKADQLLSEYPILLLPEFPTAMASLGDAYRPAAERLATMQGSARSDWQTYRATLRALVRLLLDATEGEPRVNADAALRLVSAHRRLDSHATWTELEAECGERATLKAKR